MMHVHKSKLFLTLVFSVALLAMAKAQSLLSPPYGQQWADTPTRFLNWAESKELDISINLPGKLRGKRYIKVYYQEGELGKLGISSIEARYHHSQLYEMTVDYHNPKLSLSASKAQYLLAKKAIVNQHGPMKPGEKSSKVKDGYVTETVSYHIEPVGGLMMALVSTEVTDTLRKKAAFRFSIIYRNENVIVNSKRQ